MILSIVAAMTPEGVIGDHGKLPWVLPADMKYFKALTLHKPVLMGRKTFQSLNQPLVDRINIVISHRCLELPPTCFLFHSVESALEHFHEVPEMMVIGGAQIYERLFPKAQHFYQTLVKAEIEGDCYFPKWDPNEWNLVTSTEHHSDEKNPYPYCFNHYIRKSRNR